jgi:hypothetical protein
MQIWKPFGLTLSLLLQQDDDLFSNQLKDGNAIEFTVCFDRSMTSTKRKGSKFIKEYNSIFDVTPPLGIECIDLLDICLCLDITTTNTSNITSDTGTGDVEDDLQILQDSSDESRTRTPLPCGEDALISSREQDVKPGFSPGEGLFDYLEPDIDDSDLIMDGERDQCPSPGEASNIGYALSTTDMAEIVKAALLHVVQPQACRRLNGNRAAANNPHTGLLQLIPSIFNPSYIQVCRII